MISLARFVVYGTPRPQGSHVAFMDKRTGALRVKDANAITHAAWRNSVTAQAMQARRGRPPITTAVRLEVCYRFTMPQAMRSRFGHTEPFKVSAPDLDKLDRAIYDALTASQLIIDDSIIARCVSQKLHTTGQPGAWITLSLLIANTSTKEMQLQL